MNEVVSLIKSKNFDLEPKFRKQVTFFNDPPPEPKARVHLSENAQRNRIDHFSLEKFYKSGQKT